MPSARLDIISIGTLSRNRLWNETAALRTPHATTTLVRAHFGKKTRNILVDPGLPPAALAARLNERTGLSPADIHTVFLTNFRPAHRGGLAAFPHATLLLSELEQQFARAQLENLLRDAPEQDLDAAYLRAELALLERTGTADDKLADGVDLFPLPGYTPGTSGLLVGTTMTSTLIAGDAVPTLDHFLAGQVLPDAADIATAQESMGEVYEIADLIVPGHDNLFLNPRMGR
jgi:glyoxylase-like metal-dependent hydrolase (beta-lactamase superfamily II)